MCMKEALAVVVTLCSHDTWSSQRLLAVVAAKTDVLLKEFVVISFICQITHGLRLNAKTSTVCRQHGLVLECDMIQVMKVDPSRLCTKIRE